MLKSMLAVLVLLAAIPSVSHAGTVRLLQSATQTNYSTGSFIYCGSATRNFQVQYWYCPGTNCDPTPTCGNNPYRMTAELYFNGTLISSMEYQASSAWGNFFFPNINVQPGTYTAKVTLRKRNPSCINFSTVEGVVSSNSIGVSAIPATPDFNIDGIPPTADGSPIPVCAGYIQLNAGATTCENRYTVMVEESNRWWSRTYQYEWWKEFTGQAPNGLNLQELSIDYSKPPHPYTGDPNRQGSTLIDGTLATGEQRYYRVSVCTEEPSWVCKNALIQVDGTCLTEPPGSPEPPPRDEERDVSGEELPLEPQPLR
ncbi:hypothetical protein SAMN05443639_10516 [Stigmatella erecta]|uniref:SprB repeat-containing protein n=1 Tax=Stigmatella erecta TaxID=83460 RepID=A0A1I0HQG7_9BACT|nr:hypothetical protein SAMN05443639_10516 [Stigmatella erecta]